jgi:m7GpppX diphosphatase
LFFHYPPTFYQLHLHVIQLGNHAEHALVERAHLLSIVVSNLEIDGRYYEKVTLVRK